MVHEQGDIVDSIESNIEAASVQVHEGTDQLRQASTQTSCSSSAETGKYPAKLQ